MASRDSLRLAIIIGSTRKGRFGPTIARWFDEHLQIDLIDLADAALPPVLGDSSGPEAIAFAARLDSAEAFVIVTPEYNHSFPAPLKHAIDCHSNDWCDARPTHVGGIRRCAKPRQSTHIRARKPSVGQAFSLRPASAGPPLERLKMH